MNPSDYILTVDHFGALMTLIIALVAYTRAWSAAERPSSDMPGLLFLSLAAFLLHVVFVAGPLDDGLLSLRSYLLAVILPSFAAVSLGISLVLFRSRCFGRGYRLLVLSCCYMIILIVGLLPVSTLLTSTSFLLLSLAWWARLF